MYETKFTITPKILKYISRVEAARSLIDNAALVPAWEAQFKSDAEARIVHHGTHLEGNDLSFTQAKKVIEEVKAIEKKKKSKEVEFGAENIADLSGVIGRQRDIQEVINYRNVIKYIDSLAEPVTKRKTSRVWINRRGANHRLMTKKDPPKPIPKERLKFKPVFVYQDEELLNIHAMTLEKILPPEKIGRYRTTRVVVKDAATGKITYRPPLPVEVRYQIEEFIEWLNSLTGREEHSVIRAGISHYELARIHPFVDGNGRVARAFATLVLFREGYDVKRFFSLEEYYDKDPVGYYGALQSVDKNSGDLSVWLEYFTLGLAYELERVVEKVKRMSLDSHLKDSIGKQISVSERQIKLIERLKEAGEISVPEARSVLPMVSDDTILRDFNDLVKKGIVQKKGLTKGSRYILK